MRCFGLPQIATTTRDVTKQGVCVVCFMLAGSSSHVLGYVSRCRQLCLLLLHGLVILNARDFDLVDFNGVVAHHGDDVFGVEFAYSKN